MTSLIMQDKNKLPIIIYDAFLIQSTGYTGYRHRGSYNDIPPDKPECQE